MQVTFSLAAFVAVLLVTARCCNAQASSGPATTNPAFPGSCYFPQYGVALRPGEKRTLRGRCVEISCERRSDGQLFASETKMECGLPEFRRRPGDIVCVTSPCPTRRPWLQGRP
ncbi:uncharacterized protein LOC108679395 [Hyalella azteca]|uniref:Uncharacterized protein LOC108679395 n=1 Tax=Hyalella azteca TaxID=294128 RepID=A0A8B7PDY7_HYAAZ|nr:uncharacterized protein LOC108679395 [Hyalella azteca]